MMIVVDEKDAEPVLQALTLEAKIVGKIIAKPQIIINSCGMNPQTLIFDL